MFKKEKAAGVNQTAYKKITRNNYTNNRTNFTQNFNRNLLPLPANYYSKQFPKIRINSEWVKVLCPFHDDHNPSLSINTISGGFKCWACDAHGGDVLAFQMQRYQQPFKEAAIALGAWRGQK